MLAKTRAAHMAEKTSDKSKEAVDLKLRMVAKMQKMSDEFYQQLRSMQ